MTPKARRLLSHAVNVAIIVVALIVVRNLFWQRWQYRSHVDGPTVGNVASIPGVKWTDTTTLVLALQKGCRFCEENASFYRRIHDQRVGLEPRMLAVIPGDNKEISAYLSERGVLVDQLVNVPLEEANVSIAPTLFLVDKSGKIVGVWAGKVNETEERAVANRILAFH